jgi:hypothetical protein
MVSIKNQMHQQSSSRKLKILSKKYSLIQMDLNYAINFILENCYNDEKIEDLNLLK